MWRQTCAVSPSSHVHAPYLRAQRTLQASALEVSLFFMRGIVGRDASRTTIVQSRLRVQADYVASSLAFPTRKYKYNRVCHEGEHQLLWMVSPATTYLCWHAVICTRCTRPPDVAHTQDQTLHHDGGMQLSDSTDRPHTGDRTWIMLPYERTSLASSEQDDFQSTTGNAHRDA